MKKMLTAALMVMCLSTGVQAQVATPTTGTTALETAEAMMNAASKPNCKKNTMGLRINENVKQSDAKSKCKKAYEQRIKDCEAIAGCKATSVSDCTGTDSSGTYIIGQIKCEPK